MAITSDTAHPIFRRSRAGSALLIVLAFVVLLTVLILGFFSRSILEEQVSNSSATQVKVDNFTLGAISTTLSDLKQEIEAGSAAPTFPIAGNNYIFYYAPTVTSSSSSTITFPTMLPAVTGSSMGQPPGATFGSNSLGSGAYVNLIKISLHGQKFYPSGVGTPYNSNLTTPNRAPTTGAISTGSTSDSLGALASGSNDGTSINGRYISGARWNKPLFLAPGTVFPLPDWIYVERTPTTVAQNPASFSANLVYSPNTVSTGSVVLGRYAYAIYDEGGLLDVNVAGAPTPLAPSGSLSSVGAYKSGEALADLTQIPGLTQTLADTLIGWRNNASAAQYPGTSSKTPLTGNVSSGYTWSAVNGTNYFYNVLFNPTGFLRPVSTGTSTGTLAQSDQYFTSRQQLLQFFNTALGGGNTVNSALQYLTHFSRSLEQPSFTPATADGKPATQTIATGGNDLGGGDSFVNPAFLSARVTTQYTRNDGSIAYVGDPLVKKRFALSRLAWLTYLGPIADDNGNYNTATGISNLVTILKSYGFTDTFLRQGGPTNIYKYFGLTWQQDTRASIGDNLYKWYYNHESANSSAPTAISGTAAHIRTLCTSSSGTTAVTNVARDADFFELLKAGMCLGSLGKAYGTTTSAVANFHTTDPIGYQAALDNSTDGQIIQLAANIIDQFQPAGYCARILFYDGTFSYPMEYRGVEDLPYLYRVREGKIITQDSIPAQSTLPTTTAATVTAFNANVTADQGSGVLMLEPEVWNPHAWNPSAPDTNPRPTSFRVIASSTSPGNPDSGASSLTINANWRWATGTTTFSTSISTPQTLTAATTAMTFNIPTKAQNSTNNLELFREPTLLIKAGYPTGCSLSSVSTGSVTSLFPAAQYPTGAEPNPNKYLGIYVATLPMAWSGTIPAGGMGTTGTVSNPTTNTSGIIPTGYTSYTSGSTGITYRMQYETSPGSGIWVTYDEKYGPLFSAGSYNYPGAFNGYTNHTFYQEGGSAVSDYVIGSELSLLSFDPRSSRFGLTMAGPNGRGLSSETFPLGCSVALEGANYAPLFSAGWAAPVGTGTASPMMTGAATQNAILTARPDENRGMIFTSYDGNSSGGLCFGLNCGPTGGTTPSTALQAAYGGWYTIPTYASSVGTEYGTTMALQPGMFAQNNPAVANAQSTARFAGDTQTVYYSAFNQFFADADTVVRRGMSAFVPVGTGSAAPAVVASSSSNPSGLPLKEMMDYSKSPPAENTTSNEYQSRSIMLNRPFRSVAELGYAFSGTPWRNVDMSTPESGAAGLLDVFCINDTDDPNNLVAGKVNLNTRQPVVLQSILSGAYTDEFNPGSGLSSAYATAIAKALVNRTEGTASGLGPLRNISELIGRWNNGRLSFLGFTSDPVNSTNTSTSMYDLTEALASAGSTDDANVRVQRFRDASIRALSSCGQTRVWNLMIDIIAQTGHFPSTATGLGNFLVEGEQRYWLHVAIDRYTGQVLDQQIEEVKE